MGFASMIVAILCALELILGYLNMDNSSLWSGIFLFTIFVAVVLQLASAGLATEQTKDSSNDDTNANANTFFLYASPLAVRLMMGILKFRDYQTATGGAAA